MLRAFPASPMRTAERATTCCEAEIDLRRQTELVAEQRRRLPPGGEVPVDYVFEEWDADARAASTGAPLRALRPRQGHAAPLQLHVRSGRCRSPAGGGLPELHLDHRRDRRRDAAPQQSISFAVAAKAPVEQFRAHADARGWRHARLLSSAKTTYNRDYHAEASDGSQLPMATVFTRRGGAIHHFWSSELLSAPTEPEGQHPRHVDFMWPLWAMLDRTPEGRGSDWSPRLEYS